MLQYWYGRKAQYKREEVVMDENNSFNEQDNADDEKNQEQQYQVQNQEQQYHQQFQQQSQPIYKQEDDELEKPVSVGEWMLTTLVMLIPCVNIIMMFVWAFGKTTNKSKSNYFKAALIWSLIGIGVLAVIIIALGIAGIILYSSQFQ
jgi:ABC-type Fe3+ transport system permease subunit